MLEEENVLNDDLRTCAHSMKAPTDQKKKEKGREKEPGERTGRRPVTGHVYFNASPLGGMVLSRALANKLLPASRPMFFRQVYGRLLFCRHAHLLR